MGAALNPVLIGRGQLVCGENPRTPTFAAELP